MEFRRADRYIRNNAHRAHLEFHLWGWIEFSADVMCIIYIPIMLLKLNDISPDTGVRPRKIPSEVKVSS